MTQSKIQAVCIVSLLLLLFNWGYGKDAQADMPESRNATFLAPFGTSQLTPQASRRRPSSRRGAKENFQFHTITVEIDGKAEALDEQQFKAVATGGDVSLLQTRSINELVAPLTVADVNHRWPVLSPDGTKLVYTLSTDELPMWMYDLETQNLSQIRTSRVEHSRQDSMSSFGARLSRRRQSQAQLTENEEEWTSWLSWSKDSRYYTFVGGGKIFLGAPNTHLPYQLVDEKAFVVDLRWADDNDQLVYATGRTGVGDLYRLVGLNAQLKRLKTEHGWLGENAAIPGLIPEQLTGKLSAEQEREENSAIWLSSTKLIYHAYRADTGFDLSMLDLQSGLTSPALGGTYHQMYPSLSPDKQKLTFYNNFYFTPEGIAIEEATNKFAIYGIEISVLEDFSKIPKLHPADYQRTSGVRRPDAQKGPLWSPDAKYMLYVADEPGYPIYAHRYADNYQTHEGNRLTFSQRVNCKAVDLATTGKILISTSQVGAADQLFFSVANFRAKSAN